jgi:hypothetical protein
MSSSGTRSLQRNRMMSFWSFSIRWMKNRKRTDLATITRSATVRSWTAHVPEPATPATHATHPIQSHTIPSNPITYHTISYHDMIWHAITSHHITAYPHWYSSKIPRSFDVIFCFMKHLLDGMHTVHVQCICWKYSNI